VEKGLSRNWPETMRSGRNQLIGLTNKRLSEEGRLVASPLLGTKQMSRADHVSIRDRVRKRAMERGPKVGHN